MPLSDAVQRRLIVALADKPDGQALIDSLNALLAATVAVPTRWFLSVIKDTVTTGTPGTWTPSAGAPFQRVAIDDDGVIEYIHLHADEAPAAGGTLSVEVYRNRGQTYGAGSAYGTMTLIASGSVSSGESNGHTSVLTFVSEDLKAVENGDYLHMQVTSKPNGSAWAASVDIHMTAAVLVESD